MNFILLALAIFALLAGVLFSVRFLAWVFMKANFKTVAAAFAYALYGSVLLAVSAWLFSISGVLA